MVDTNVPLVANGKAEQADLKCEVACIRNLIQIQSEQRTLLDDKMLIMGEYRTNLSHSGQPGVGDAFFKWLWENQANEQHCRIVPLTIHSDRGFVEFPDDARLSSFDLADRKFVAVALAKPYWRMASMSFSSAPNLWRTSAFVGEKKRPPKRGTSAQRCYRWGGVSNLHYSTFFVNIQFENSRLCLRGYFDGTRDSIYRRIQSILRS